MECAIDHARNRDGMYACAITFTGVRMHHALVSTSPRKVLGDGQPKSRADTCCSEANSVYITEIPIPCYQAFNRSQHPCKPSSCYNSTMSEQAQVALQDQEEPSDGVPIVLVMGASGFVATHVIKQLLEQGKYRVRGTVRSTKKQEKVCNQTL